MSEVPLQALLSLSPATQKDYPDEWDLDQEPADPTPVQPCLTQYIY